MTNRKQSAVSRRQSNRLSGDTNLSLTSINNNLNSFIQSTNFNINSITNNLNQTTQVSSNVTLNLDYQLDVTNTGSLAYTANDHEVRIQALEAAGPGGGGGGIDPTNPDIRIVYEDFLYLSSGDETGNLSLYSTLWLGNPLTSGLIFNPGQFVYFIPASNEVGHPGILNVVHSGDPGNFGCSGGVGSPCVPVWQPAFFGIDETANVLLWEDVSRITIILKVKKGINDGDDYGTDQAFMFGLSTNLGDPTGITEEGIYFTGDLSVASNWQTVTKVGGTVTTNTTAIPLTNNTWYRLDLKRINTTDVEFYIDNTLVFTHTTNVSTASLNLGLSIYSSFLTGEDDPLEMPTTSVDFIGVKLGDPESGGVLPTGVTVEGTLNEVDVTYNSTTQVYTVGLPSAITVDTVNTDEIFLDPTVTPPASVTAGHLIYDSTYDTVVVGMNGSINVPIGQALFKQAHNNTGSTINKGDIVYVSGSHGTTILQVAKAQANSEATSAPTIGLAAENIAHGADGFIITQGLLTGLNTNIYPAGQRIYLSDSVAGGWRTTFPAAPLHGTFVGWVVKSAGSGAGSIYVKIQNYNEISELSDVYIPSTPSNNDVLQWDGVDARWENRSLATAGIAATGHTHSLTDITQSSANKYEVPQWNGTNWVAYDTRLPENRVIVVSEMNAAGDWTVYASGTGTSNIFTTAALTFDGRFGILTSGTGTTATGRAGIGSAVLDQVVFGTNVTEFECIIRVPTLSDATNRFVVDAGFSDNQAGIAVDGIHFQYSDTVNSGKWICLRYNNNASANVDSGITVVAGTWYKLKIIVSTTEANFYINNTLVGTLNTIPTGTTRATGVFTGIRKTVGTTARTINTDYMHYTQETTR